MDFDSGMMQLFVGDCVQRDKGMVIIQAVGTKSADCIDLKTGRHCVLGVVAVAKHLLIERRGTAGLVKVLGETKPKENRDRVCLELGDEIIIARKLWTAFELHGDTVKLGTFEGEELVEKRCCHRWLLPDHEHHSRDAEGRTKHLKEFLANRKLPGSESQKSAAPTKESETVMATKKKSEKKSKSVKATNGEVKSRNEFIWSLLDGSKTKNEIIALAIDKFDGVQKKVAKQVNNAPFYMRKAGLKPAWKETEKAAKE